MRSPSLSLSRPARRQRKACAWFYAVLQLRRADLCQTLLEPFEAQRGYGEFELVAVGLCRDVECAELETAGCVGFGGRPAHDDRDPDLAAGERLQELDPPHAGQLQVE